jgi:glycosyltransferase involved in cell wall biosynthesis
LPAYDWLEAKTGLPMPVPTKSARVLLEEEVRRSDAVIIHDALYATSQLARLYAHRHRRPWFLFQHIGDIPYRNPLLRSVLALANRSVTSAVLRRAPQTVFISNTVCRQFVNVRYPAPPKLLFNGVDHKLFFPADSTALPALRSRLRLPADRIQLLFVGRFVEKKGLVVLRELAALRPDVDLLMAGGGPLDPSAWQLRNIRILGRMERAELADLYRACDALLLPSVGEGFPLVIQEAMASALAVFCGSESAAADPGASQFLTATDIDLGRPRLTAQLIADAVGRSPPAKVPGSAAYARATYDWDSNAEWLEERLREWF